MYKYFDGVHFAFSFFCDRAVLTYETTSTILRYFTRMGLLSAIVVNVVGGAVIYGTGGLGAAWVAPMLGFGSVGISAGSTAAAAQAYYGNLVGGSIISQLTAVAMAAPTP